MNGPQQLGLDLSPDAPKTSTTPQANRPLRVSVAVTVLTEIMRDFLMEGDRKPEGGEFSTPRGTWKRGLHLCVFLEANSNSPHSIIAGIGIAETSGRAGDFEKRLTVREFLRTPVRILVTELKSQLRQFRDGLDKYGTLPPARGRELIKLLRGQYPELTEHIDHLTRLLAVEPQTSEDRPVRPYERDAMGVLFEAFDIDREILKDWRPTTHGANFVHGISGRDLEPREGWHIAHDQTTFLNWFQKQTENLAWGLFQNRYRTRTLLVANVDRTNVETNLGVDLVYYNPNQGSFVLLQYKKMKETPSGEFLSPVDSHFRDQIKRMRETDAKYRDDNHEHLDLRLVNTPCFVKLCKPVTRIARNGDLAPGIYLTRKHFEAVHASSEARGPKGGASVGGFTARRYLTNTEFTSLLSNGWLGTRGTATEALAAELRLSLDQDRSVIFGVHLDGLPLTNHSNGHTR